MFCGSILGCLIAFMRLSKFRPLEKFASIYITVIRGTPMLVQLYIVYHQLDFIPYPTGSIFGVDLERALPCIIALSINSSAYVAEIIPTSDSKAAALKSQLIVGEPTAPKPFMDTSWLTPGCGLVSMHSNEVMEDVFLKADGIVADYWTQLKQHTNPLSKLTKEGKLDESQIMDLSELVLGTKKLRTTDDQFVAAASMGLGALDIMIAYQLYLNATEMGIGTKVNLWDKPLWE